MFVTRVWVDVRCTQGNCKFNSCTPMRTYCVHIELVRTVTCKTTHCTHTMCLSLSQNKNNDMFFVMGMDCVLYEREFQFYKFYFNGFVIPNC